MEDIIKLQKCHINKPIKKTNLIFFNFKIMKPNVKYVDLIGSAAADISDLSTNNNELQELLSYFKIDEERFEVIGVSINGTTDLSCYLICLDKVKTTISKKHIVEIPVMATDDEDILSLLFKRLSIVLLDRTKVQYKDFEIDETIKFNDCSSFS